jgi:homocysteine S-methyltransferase
MGLRELLRAGPAAIDGGLASELEARGQDLSGRLWSARLVMDDPAAIRRVHSAYFAAGARVAISASYQASRTAMRLAGLDPATADLLLTRSVEIARQARDHAVAEDAGELLVAASVGPFGAALADGSEYRGNYGLTHEELVRFHTERLDVLAGAAPDLFAVETIPDAAEAAAIVEALDSHPYIPAWITFSCRDGATTCGGDAFEDAVQVAASAPSVVAVGVNCTAPEYVTELLAAGRKVSDLPFVVYPNAGRTWDARAGEWSGAGSDTVPGDQVRAWLAAGAKLVGGCCGLGPSGIGAISAVLTAA